MKPPKLSYRYLLVLIPLFTAQLVAGQAVIKGTVYDESQRFAMSGVSVLSTLGKGTSTDSSGHYSIRLALDDSIYFSYLGKSTLRFPVREIAASGQPFDMALAINIDSLPAAYVRGNNYYLDSLQNRKDYAKAFNYSSNYLTNMKTNRGGMGIGLNLDMFLNGKENRRMEALQKRLEQEEEDNYIDHRFSKAVVRRVTGLTQPALDTFMAEYRPTKEFIESCATDYEFYHYIREWGNFFAEDWAVRHPDIPAVKRGADSLAMVEPDSVALKATDSVAGKAPDSPAVKMTDTTAVKH